MKYSDFNMYVEDLVSSSLDLLTSKGKEYAECKGADEDRLSQFKMAANLMNSTQEMALLGMATKHLVSVAKMCIATQTREDQPLDLWKEKIQDAVNYLLILWAMVHENRTEFSFDGSKEELIEDLPDEVKKMTLEELINESEVWVGEVRNDD